MPDFSEHQTYRSPSQFARCIYVHRAFDADALIGAGTVLAPADVLRLHEIGGRIVISPNFDPAVVSTTKSAGMPSCPGVFTPSQAFGALNAGADILKHFPADLHDPAAISVWRAFLPTTAQIAATGGTNAETLSSWLSVGVDIIGVGSALFKPKDDLDKVRPNARWKMSSQF
ncbi:beta/alpha barrel domain-containing protein [Cochlodiniinecator piscidefendens]|uniref:2-dehydro-3-deoxy-6-phosphogalactonate aldolase n=1 Tax=Cochlodiniinecator piscidefendens TaxID=2715756 RepID=UPI001409ECBC